MRYIMIPIEAKAMVYCLVDDENQRFQYAGVILFKVNPHVHVTLIGTNAVNLVTLERDFKEYCERLSLPPATISGLSVHGPVEEWQDIDDEFEVFERSATNLEVATMLALKS